MFKKKKKNQKLAALWLAGEVVNHVEIYGSKADEGLSAFQRRSCDIWLRNKIVVQHACEHKERRPDSPTPRNAYMASLGIPD